MDAKHYGDVDGMDGDGGDAAVADEDRCLSLPDLCRMKMDPWWTSFPLQIPSGGEVFATSGLSVSPISFVSSQKMFYLTGKRQWQLYDRSYTTGPGWSRRIIGR